MEKQYFIIFAWLGFLSQMGPCEPARTFRNPILDIPVYGQYIYQHTDGFYYMTLTLNGLDLYVYKNSILSDWRLAERKLVYKATSEFINLSQSEIHFIRDNWYIYFEMGKVNGTQYEMYVIEGQNPANPLGQYSGEILLSSNVSTENTGRWDGTVLQCSDGRLYFIYSGSSPDIIGPLNLYIVSMSSRTAINGTRSLIKENGTLPFGERVYSPHVFENANRTFILYTGHSADQISCLGLMGIDGNVDPLVAGNWWHHADDCVFQGNVEESVWIPGYPSVIKSPDLKENWMTYNAQQENRTAASVVTARIIKFTWNVDSTPQFPKPSGLTVPVPLPSGES